MLNRLQRVIRICGLIVMLLLMASCSIQPPTPQSVPGPTPPQQTSTSEQPIAFLTYVSGDVTIKTPMAQRRFSGLLAPTLQQQNNDQAQPFQPLYSGTTVSCGANGNATMVCANNYAYQVPSKTTVTVNEASCNTGQSLPPQSAQSVEPHNGRVLNNNGSAILESEPREKESDYGQLPIILSPRNSSLLDFTPSITWVDVSEALEYELSLSGLASFDNIVFSTNEVTCIEDGRTAPNRICTHAWPTTWPLEPEQRYFLTVSARTGIASPLRPSESSALRTLSADEVKAVAEEGKALIDLDLDPVTKQLLLGGLYARHALSTTAIAAYAEVVAMQPSPIPYVALGDLYLSVDLQRFAFLAYQQALDLLTAAQRDDPAVTASAEFGIGLVYYSRANYKEAEPHFVAAVEHYRQLGAAEEQSVAEHALEETSKRLK